MILKTKYFLPNLRKMWNMYSIWIGGSIFRISVTRIQKSCKYLKIAKKWGNNFSNLGIILILSYSHLLRISCCRVSWRPNMIAAIWMAVTPFKNLKRSKSVSENWKQTRTSSNHSKRIHTRVIKKQIRDRQILLIISYLSRGFLGMLLPT